MRARYLFTAAAIVGVFGGCDSTEPRVPTSVEVDQQTVTLEHGESVLIGARLLDQDGRVFDIPPEGFAITWSSTAPGVASVVDGQITGLGAGTAIITAHAGDLTPAEVHVTVQARTVTAQMGFSFTGDRSGSFSVERTFAIDELWADDWAATFFAIDDGQNFTDAMGLRVRGDGLVDFMWFWVEGHITTAGTRTAGALLFIGWDLDADTIENLYFETDGTVTHSIVTADRMAGTFSLEMEEVDTGAALSVTGGTFDLPVVTEDDIFGAVAAFESSATLLLPEPVRQLRRPFRR